MPALVKVLREHRLRSLYSGDDDPVFASDTGRPMNGRNVTQRGLDNALLRAGLDHQGDEKITFHELRRTFASILISQGHDPVSVVRQLGHARASITLDAYAHMLDHARHGENARDRTEAAFGILLVTGTGRNGVG